MKFTFDGHEYTLVDGEVFDSGGELVCTVTTDVADEYWMIENGEDFHMRHVHDSTMLEAVKSFISATY